MDSYPKLNTQIRIGIPVYCSRRQKEVYTTLTHRMACRVGSAYQKSPWFIKLPYILESNPHHFYSFRGIKNQMRITIACGLDSRSRAGFWKNDGATVRAVKTIQYNHFLFYLLLIIIYYLSVSPSSLITESLSVLRRDCARLLRKTRFMVPV
jgi:hypothetical protein